MKTAITNLPAADVAYIRQTGPYGPGLMSLWDKLRGWANGRGLWTDDVVTYGISLDNPMDTAPEKCRYDACITIPEDAVIDEHVERQTLPGGRYVVVPFHGQGPKIGEEFGRIFDQVIPENDCEFDFTRPVFERYTGDCRVDPDGSFGCDLCVPIK